MALPYAMGLAPTQTLIPRTADHAEASVPQEASAPMDLATLHLSYKCYQLSRAIMIDWVSRKGRECIPKKGSDLQMYPDNYFILSSPENKRPRRSENAVNFS